MGGDARIVTPDFLQQGLTRYRLLPGAIKVTQNSRFLFSQPDLAAFWIEQQFRTRPERVGPDGEDGIFAGFVLAQLRADTCKQDRKPERLGDVIVRPGLEAEDGVGIGVVAGQHDDRALKPFLRKMRTASRPSTSGRPTSMITRSTGPALAACTPLVPLSTEMASNSSCSASCSRSASRSSASSSTIRIVRLLAIV